MGLDDVKFVEIFDSEWKHLKNRDVFKTFLFFYEEYINKEFIS